MDNVTKVQMGARGKAITVMCRYASSCHEAE